MKEPWQAIEEMQNELESRRADSAQLERMVEMINEAMPHFTSAMGSEADHAEVALHALIERRGELTRALHAMTERYVSLVNSGDAGDWEPESEQVVRDARKAIRRYTGNL